MASLYRKLVDPELVVYFQKLCGVDSPVWHKKSPKFEAGNNGDVGEEICQNGNAAHGMNGATLTSERDISNGHGDLRKRFDKHNGVKNGVREGDQGVGSVNGYTHSEIQVNGTGAKTKTKGLANAKVAKFAELLNDTLGEELRTDSEMEYKIHNKFLYFFFNIGANLGNEAFYIVFFPTLMWNIDGWIARRMVVFWCLFMYIGQATKDILKIPRPPSPPVVRIEKRYALEYGMPSTHAMTGLGMPFTILYLAYGRYEFPFVIGFLIATLWCAMISLSRLYLGMHTVLDIVAGLGYTLLLMPIYYFWAMEAIDSVAQSSSMAAPLFLVVTGLLCCLTYPKLERWSTARGDTTLVLGTGVGQALGMWWSKHRGIMHPGPPASAQPFPIRMPTLSSLTTATLRLVIGTVLVVIVRFVVKTIVFEASCWLSGVDRKDPKAKEQLPVELPCKYITYIALGICAMVICPAVFVYLDIQRPSLFYEL